MPTYSKNKVIKKIKQLTKIKQLIGKSMTEIRPNFWLRFGLDELTQSEWEALCDGCGLCCLVKLQDEDTGKVVYTSLACRLLDCTTGRCQDYPNRSRVVSDCVSLTPSMLKKINWLPRSCAYRCLQELRPLPSWHPLISKNDSSVRLSGHSVSGRCVSEVGIKAEDEEEYVITWVKI